MDEPSRSTSPGCRAGARTPPRTDERSGGVQAPALQTAGGVRAPALQCPRVFGSPRLCFEELDSTNAELLRQASEGAPEGTVCVAETQTAGRGRSSRVWLDRPGNGLLCSVLLRPRLTPERAGLLPLAIGVGVVMGLRHATRADARLKWPNDVVILGGAPEAAGYRKLGGILVEGNGDAYVAGIGVNVNGVADDFASPVRETIVTLEMVTGERRPPQSLLTAILAGCEEAYFSLLRGRAGALITSFAALDICTNHEVAVTRPTDTLVGCARGVAADGGLVLEDASGQVTVVYAGDVSVRLA